MASAAAAAQRRARPMQVNREEKLKPRDRADIDRSSVHLPPSIYPHNHSYDCVALQSSSSHGAREALLLGVLTKRVSRSSNRREKRREREGVGVL
jgi:hypothetical protein